MNGTIRTLHCFALAFCVCVPAAAHNLRAKEFLTPEEIEKIQQAQEIDKRIEVYMEAAELRLRSAVDRLTGKESEPEDPLEFFSVEDMLDGYYRILDSVMFNLDEAFQKPSVDRGKVKKALENLKKKTDQAGEELEILKRLAEEKQLEGIWRLVARAREINQGAKEGAELGLESFKSPGD